VIYILIFITALFSSLALVPVLRRWALSTGTVDQPDERKIHNRAIPRLGGIAIFLSFLFSMLVFVDASKEIRGVMAGGLVVFVTGLIDDLYGLTPKRKFAGEIAGVLITISVGHLYLQNLGNLFGFGPVVLPLWAAIPFTLFAVVGVVNAINLIDGLDGLSGGVSVIALTAFFLLALVDGQTEVLLLCAALLGALTGFLKYNIYPARIFMGDAGSLSVGFLLGFLAVFLTQGAGSNVSPMVPVVILGLPIIDALWVMTRRVMKGLGPFSPDMTHVHHKFLNLGVQHRFTVIIIYGLSLFWAAIAVLARQWPEFLLLAVYAVISSLFYGLLRYLINHRKRFAFFAHDSPHGLRETPHYKSLAVLADRVRFLLLLVLGFYLILAVYVGVVDETVRWVELVYLVGFALVWVVRSLLSVFLLKSYYYLGGVVVALGVDPLTDLRLTEGLQMTQIELWLFALMLLLIGLKGLFRQQGEFFVTLPELMFLGFAVFALVAFSQIPQLSHLADLPIRGGLLFLAINVVFFNYRTEIEPLSVQGERASA